MTAEIYIIIYNYVFIWFNCNISNGLCKVNQPLSEYIHCCLHMFSEECIIYLSPLALTCVRTLHAHQYDNEANQDGKEEHYDNGHHHTNDESSVVKCSWRKRHSLVCLGYYMIVLIGMQVCMYMFGESCDRPTWYSHLLRYRCGVTMLVSNSDSDRVGP